MDRLQWYFADIFVEGILVLVSLLFLFAVFFGINIESIFAVRADWLTALGRFIVGALALGFVADLIQNVNWRHRKIKEEL